AQAGYQLLKHRAVLWTDVCLNAVARVFLGQTHENPLKLVGLLTDRMDCFGERLHGLLLLDRRGLRLAVRLLLCSGGLITNHESQCSRNKCLREIAHGLSWRLAHGDSPQRMLP